MFSKILNELSLPFFFFFLAVPCGMRDLSSLTRDRTRAPGSGSTSCHSFKIRFHTQIQISGFSWKAKSPATLDSFPTWPHGSVPLPVDTHPPRSLTPLASPLLSLQLLMMTSIRNQIMTLRNLKPAGNLIIPPPLFILLTPFCFSN